jgi:pimeloyl-ACP methyl ester carboxylesterase
VGLSAGGNTLLHMAARAPERVEAMVLSGATSEGRSEADWAEMRGRHKLGDDQIRALTCAPSCEAEPQCEPTAARRGRLKAQMARPAATPSTSSSRKKAGFDQRV